jgi:DNA-binding transcriptional LysR family regulator
MNLDSEKIQAFYQLSIDGTFSKAAKSLGLTQSALSQRIAKLEDELEMTLAIRSSKQFHLTENGEKLIQYFKAKIALDEEFLNKTSHTSFGKSQLRIAGFSSISRSILMKMIKDFKYPHDFQFEITSQELYELPSLLQSGKFDFIFTSSPIQKTGIISKKCGEEELVRIVPAKLPETEVKVLNFIDHDLEDETTLEFFNTQNWEFSGSRNYLDDIYGIINGVELKLGQAIVSKHLVINNKKVKIKKAPKKVHSPIYINYFDKTYYPEIEKKFIKFVSESFKDYLLS